MAEPRPPRRTRVLVIGGGPVGLVVSGLLSRRGIPNLVIERRRTNQRAPAAHVLRRRPMEILDGLGVGDEVRNAVPRLPLDFITWCNTLGGTEIGRLDLRPIDPASGTRADPPWTNCPQNLLEPILLRHARSRVEATVVRGATCLDLSQSATRLQARIRLEDGSERDVDARWAIAADGASSPTRRQLGITMQGTGPLARFWMVHFEADLRPWIENRPGPIFWILNPESPGTLIVHDPAGSHVLMLARLGGAQEEQTIPARLGSALGVAVEPKILSIDLWSPHVQVADRYRQGRAFLIGDAAHRFPPTGGLGLNTGIQEARDLVTRLARVEAGEASESHMDGYDAACRPAARANADVSLRNLVALGEISRVLGPCPNRIDLDRRLASLTPHERRRLSEAIEAQRSHFLFEGSQPGMTTDVRA